LYHTTINIKANTSNNGATFDLTWNAYGGLPFGIFELHKKTLTNQDTIFDNVSSNVFSYTDVNANANDDSLAYWITVPLDDACDTIRAASFKSRSNTVRRDNIFDGIERHSLSLSSFEIIPNPNNGNFTLSIKNDFKNQIEIDIISVVGTKVWSSILTAGKQQLKVDLPELGEGVYLIQVTESNKKHYKKMVINK
jgi:hypothetical protein